MAISLFALVLGAVLAVLDVTGKGAVNDQERNTALNEDTVRLNQMVRELRQARAVVGPTSGSSSNYMDVLVRTASPSGPSVDRRVLYRCDVPAGATGLRQCIRYEFAATDTSPAGSFPVGAESRLAIDRLSNGTVADPVFTDLSSPAGVASRPSYGQATIKTPGRGERTIGYRHEVVLADAFHMRNLDLAR